MHRALGLLKEIEDLLCSGVHYGGAVRRWLLIKKATQFLRLNIHGLHIQTNRFPAPAQCGALQMVEDGANIGGVNHCHRDFGNGLHEHHDVGSLHTEHT